MSVTLLVRHGQASFGMGNYDRLSEHGQAQARRLGAVLLERGIDVQRIVSGDLDRQRETADVLATALGGLPVAVDPRWAEYDHQPLIARVRPSYRKPWMMVADLARTPNPNRKLQELIDQALEAWVVSDEPPGEVETFAEYTARADAALEAASSEPGVTVVVSSAGTITAAVAPHIGIPYGAWPALHRVMVNSSVTKVVRGRRGLTLISFNEHGHLEGVPGLQITYR